MSFTKTAVFVTAISMAGFLFAAGDPKVSPADDYLELPEDCMATEFAVGAAVAEDEGAVTVVAPVAVARKSTTWKIPAARGSWTESPRQISPRYVPPSS